MDGNAKWFTMVHHGTDIDCDIREVLMEDQERSHFVTSARSSLPGRNIYRKRWRKIGNESEKVVKETDITQTAELYCINHLRATGATVFADNIWS